MECPVLWQKRVFSKKCVFVVTLAFAELNRRAAERLFEISEEGRNRIVSALIRHIQHFCVCGIEQDRCFQHAEHPEVLEDGNFHFIPESSRKLSE